MSDSHVRIEYTKRPDGRLNQWKFLTYVQSGLADHVEFIKAGRPEYMSQRHWVLTGVFDTIPRPKKV